MLVRKRKNRSFDVQPPSSVPENTVDTPPEKVLPKTKGLDIGPLPTSKDEIEQPPLAEDGQIPKLCTSAVFCGISGMGKSNLLCTLVIDPRFYDSSKDGHGWFTHRFLLSPTGDMDDIQKHLHIQKKFICTDLSQGHYILRGIMNAQKRNIKKTGYAKAPKILCIYDDCISHQDFLSTDEFIRSFIACRHFNMSTWICAQAWTGVPRKCRLQAKNIFFFAAPQTEVEHLCDEYCPPQMNKKQFYALVNYATEEPFSFLYINNTVPMEERFRRNFDEIIDLNTFRALQFSTTKPASELNCSSQEEEDSTNNECIAGFERGVEHGGSGGSNSGGQSNLQPSGRTQLRQSNAKRQRRTGTDATTSSRKSTSGKSTAYRTRTRRSTSTNRKSSKRNTGSKTSKTQANDEYSNV